LFNSVKRQAASCLLGIATLSATAAAPAAITTSTISTIPSARFACGGSVETEVWTLWDTKMRDFLQKSLQERVLVQRDTYALYDFQTNTHNLVSMASRCKRTGRLQEIAKTLRIAYDALELAAPGSRQWVCRGGSTCTAGNGLLNKEIMLNSVQFLAIAASAANALATSGSVLNNDDKLFITDTVAIATEHLLRWGDDTALSRYSTLSKATPQDVVNNSSLLFFTDQDLWLIAVYAELSGLRQWQRNQGLSGTLTAQNEIRLQQNLSALLQFFNARVSLRSMPYGRVTNDSLADLDRGYTRLLAANRYAGYESAAKPVACINTADGKTISEVRIPAESVPIRDDIGWDISHARRLVHALDALERNRTAIRNMFYVSDTQLPATGLTKAFAATLVATVWNGNQTEPLFSNWWSGANGWYRVSYSTNGACSEGYPPNSMSDSFLTGGYLTWARHWPAIGALGARMYDLSCSIEGEQSTFIANYYPQLKKTASNYRATRFMFLPSLVGVGI
jgi:hypothetical protein